MRVATPVVAARVRRPKRLRPAGDTAAGVEVRALTERLAEEAWQQVICHEGMDEELRSHFAALRVRPAYGDARRSAFPSPGRRTSCS
jgi:hypothetical protein